MSSPAKVPGKLGPPITLDPIEFAGIEDVSWVNQVVDSLPAAIYTCDAEGRVTYCNEAAVALWGRRPVLGKEQWCGSSKIYTLDGAPVPLDQCPMAVAVREGRSVRGLEVIVERPDGTRAYVLPHPDPLRNGSGRIIGAINMLVDITERKEAERAMGHLAAIVESSCDAIVSKTVEGIVTSWNRTAEEMFGYTSAEMIGQPIRRVFPPEREKEEDEILGRLRAGQRIDHFENVRVKKDGRRFPVSVTISPVRDSTGRIIGASKIVRDITRSKEAEERIRKLNEELEQRVVERTAQLVGAFESLKAETDARKQLAKEVTQISEREQQRLGQELHDDLAHEMTGIAFMLGSLREKLRPSDPGASDRLQQLTGMLSQTVEKARNLAKGFYPVELERYGFARALEEMARTSAERFGLRCRLQIEHEVPSFPPEVAVEFFRIAQEALHNAAKHAEANEVTVDLAMSPDQIVLTVIDDGKGLPKDFPQSKGMGQKIMRYRAETIGATLDVRNRPKCGAVVTCTLPLWRAGDAL